MEALVQPAGCFGCTAKLCRFSTTDDTRRAHATIDLARGERVETCDESCVRFWTVMSGTAVICTTLSDGRRQISGIETAGNTICGPMANEASPIWLEALEPTQICEIDFTGDIASLQEDPAFLRMMFGVIHRRLETATRHLTTLGRLDSTERVTLFLAQWAEASPGHGPVHLPMSREEIADYLGLNAETVSRVLGRLKKAGLFRFLSPSEFVVPDPKAVARRLPVAPAQAAHNPIDNAGPPSRVARQASAASCPIEQNQGRESVT